ncbi:hypothetical protein, partial [Mycolicibacterium llatzerense]
SPHGSISNQANRVHFFRGTPELEQARKRVDESRDTLYSIAQHHASLLAEVEKIILRMNDKVSGVSDDSET